MSNIIFCDVNELLCNKIHNIVKDKKIVDCGAGRGLFGAIYNKLYDTNIISIDYELPDIPLSNVIQRDCEYYSFSKNSIPIFIRPCHSKFVHNTIIRNRYKLSKYIYISKPENLNIDLDTTNKWYTITEVPDYIGSENERIYIIDIINKSNMQYLQGKTIYCSDPILSYAVNTQEEEFWNIVAGPLEDKDILIDGSKLEMTNRYIPNTKCDTLFFDYGGMSIGNSLLETQCRYITKDAINNPNTNYVIVSQFTKYAMLDALKEFSERPHNIFLDLNSFIEYYKIYYND